MIVEKIWFQLFLAVKKSEFQDFEKSSKLTLGSDVQQVKSRALKRAGSPTMRWQRCSYL
jgi:hypothetical protein